MLQLKWCTYSPFCYFQRDFREIYKRVLPARCEIAMIASGYINDNIFLQHFQKHRSPGEDGHSSYSWLMSLNCCRQTGNESLFVHPHMTHVLQLFHRTVFKPIKIYYHQKATKFVYENPNIAIGKFRFLWPCIVSRVWRQKNQQDAAIRCLLLTSVWTCFGHHYAHLHENKGPVTAFGALIWFCWM
jgi:hypothetical protein